MPITRDTTDRLTAGLGRLLRVGRQLSHRAASELYGDLPSYGWALLVPLAGGEQRTSALAQHLGIDCSVVSRQVAVLERAGYLARRPDPVDGRASLIGLSEAGVAVLARTREVRARWAAGALAGWSEDDAVLLAGLIERLGADLDVVPGPGRALPGHRPGHRAARDGTARVAPSGPVTVPG